MNLKKMDIWDIGLIKLAVASGAFFLITVWPAAMDLVHSIHWGWFLGAMVLFALRPWKRMFM
jgi:polyferredoxin